MEPVTEPQRGLARFLPLVGWLSTYPLGWLRYDVTGGLVAAVVVVPQAMAYAAIAGLPVEVGLYTALVPMTLYALLGTSRTLSVSTTSAISILVATQLPLVVAGGDPGKYLIAASTLAILVGIILILAGVFRLGFIANFISDPVLSGFKAGIGVVILVDQLDSVLGITISKGGFFETLFEILSHASEAHMPTVFLTLVTLAILLLLPRVDRRIPASLVAVAVGILASGLFNLEAQGVELVGIVPSGLPDFVLPDLALARMLWPVAAGIALMSFTESVAVARAFRDGKDQRIDANQELYALGVANIIGGFFQAYPAGGGTSQTAVNNEAGAKTQLSALVTAGTVVLVLLFFAQAIGFLPQATLSAIILVVASKLIKLDEFRNIARIRRLELLWALMAFLGVIFLGTLQGIAVAIMASMLTLIYDASRPPIYEVARKPGTDVFRRFGDHPQDETFPGLLMLRTEGRMYFASVPQLRDHLTELIVKSKPRVLVFDCSVIPDFEYTALRMLDDFEQTSQAAGIELWLAALNPVPLEIIRRSPVGQRLGNERMFFNLSQALEAYQKTSTTDEEGNRQS